MASGTQRIFRRRQTRIWRLFALRPLRPVPEPLPHLSPMEPGSGFAARTDSADELVDQGRLASWANPSSRISIAAWIAALAKRPARRGSNTASWSKLARAQIEQKYKRPLASRVARDFVYRRLLPYPQENRHGRAFPALYQRSGLAIVRARHRHPAVAWIAGPRAACCRRSIPNSSSASLVKLFRRSGPRRARVAFFAGCVAQVTFSDLNRATIRVLQANGCEVVVPARQGLLRRASRSRRACATWPHAGARKFASLSRPAISTPSSPTPPDAARR